MGIRLLLHPVVPVPLLDLSVSPDPFLDRWLAAHRNIHCSDQRLALRLEVGRASAIRQKSVGDRYPRLLGSCTVTCFGVLASFGGRAACGSRLLWTSRNLVDCTGIDLPAGDLGSDPLE